MGFFSAEPPKFVPAKFEPPKDDKADPLQQERLREQRRLGRLSTYLSKGKKTSEKVKL